MTKENQKKIINTIYKVIDIQNTGNKLYHKDMLPFEVEYAIRTLEKKRETAKKALMDIGIELKHFNGILA